MTTPRDSTRTFIGTRHALITPDGHVISQVPGMGRAHTIAHITPALGAGFVQATVVFEAGGKALFPAGPDEFFIFVLSGDLELTLESKMKTLGAGSYVYQPPQTSSNWRSKDTATLIYFQKKYQPQTSLPAPLPVLSHTDNVPGQPFMGDANAMLQVLLPDNLSYDLAVNIFTFQPGAALPFVETHVMEHGLLMLSGQGDYRLEEKAYAVAAGDVIWMAPFCPQWFIATGDQPASYIYYKDVNRPLLR